MAWIVSSQSLYHLNTAEQEMYISESLIFFSSVTHLTVLRADSLGEIIIRM